MDGNATLLAEAERILTKHDPATFDTTIDAWPECSEYVWQVEDREAWRSGYPSVEDFYAAHEARHPDIRHYGAERRAEREAGQAATMEGMLKLPGGLPSERFARRQQEDVSGETG